MAPKKPQTKETVADTITWRAAEYEFSPKNRSWYVTAVGVAVLLVGLALWQRNFFFAVFVVIAAGTIALFSRQRPRTVEFRVTEKEIAVEEQVTPIELFDGFAIHERSGKLNQLVLRRHASANPYLIVPIDATLAVRARTILKKTLEEFEYRESLVDTFAEWLGF